MSTSSRSVAIVTLGCARNEVDSSEIAGRLAQSGWKLVNDPAQADVALVNTCGFVEAAKKDSVDALLEAAELKDGHRTQAVVAVGCMAERYGRDLADALPEADAVLGFDAYPELSGILGDVLAGHRPQPHVPRDRRTLLPVSPVERRAAARAHTQTRMPTELAAATPSGPPIVRRLTEGQVWAPLKLASGCDRRCAFCAIPAFRGAFISRHPDEVLAETEWLVERGVREVFLVSENTTSYGKDLADLQALEKLLPRLAKVSGLERIRVSYLQPAEVRPGLLEAIATTDKVAAYFDLSFQHSAPGVLRRMRRFGSSADFLALVERARALAPAAGIRSNVIVGFPGETEDDLAELHGFLADAMLDVVGVFGYSDEEGTEAVRLDGHLDAEEIADRLERTTDLVEQLTSQRAEDRLGERIRVIVEGVDEEDRLWGRADHQGPEVDGLTYLVRSGAAAGDVLDASVIDCDGVDLVAEPA